MPPKSSQSNPKEIPNRPRSDGGDDDDDDDDDDDYDDDDDDDDQNEQNINNKSADNQLKSAQNQ